MTDLPLVEAFPMAPVAPMAATVDPDHFRSLMSTFPSGVAVVTTMGPDGRPRGMTCSSVCSVTLEPPTLLMCARRLSPTLHAMLKMAQFTVNLLHGRARATAELFASGAADRFERVRWRAAPGYGGPHLVEESHSVADCRVAGTVEMGDHVVVFGEVYGIERCAPAEPLLYGLRAYSSWYTGPEPS
ncbi:flavin reductase family protein [Nonomuraea guangzhouensis]|uniref:Flavin reductase family protein n=1 Tax=Nonomuraea guangzhouensis TaxID=1291555 RepID=A0ABW4GBC3_9ACTN|nr:flavin reductase family protein [Nonomuraea guangzhouensis]